MSRKITIVLFISIFFTVSAFAHDVPEIDIKIPVFKPAAYFAVAVGEDEAAIPDGIANNKFYLESLKYNRLAMEMYEIGDYDASAGFAQDAIRYAELSDEFVADQLITEAKRLIAWADKNNIAARFPNNYNEGVNQYEIAVASQSNEEWNDAITAAIRAIEIFAAFESGRPITTTTTVAASSSRGLARQYTVRTWRVERDCLWTIAGYPWVYNDPWKWKVLYDANKDKMPEPANPDLIEPGMVLEIPSIQGESRQGMWRP
ncbi:MAG: LysM peptidoglycan-binding domain-containing protein [Treponema sp.]|nr:LysM peptidoglycan-binding domain-containing protein [Treponema sp.]